MQIQITARQFGVTDDIRAYVEKRGKKIESIFNRIVELQVVIDFEKPRYLAEMMLATRKATFHAQAENHEVFICLDAVMDKIERQIRRHKERLKDWRHRPPRDAAAQVTDTQDATAEEPSEEGPVSLIRVPERFASKPMTPEDAAMQLHTNGDSLLLFLNAQTNQINVVYEDEQGEYGWVEPRFA